MSNSSVDSQTIGISLNGASESPEIILGVQNQSSNSNNNTPATTATEPAPSPEQQSLHAPAYSNPTADDKSKFGPLFPFGIKDVKISAVEDQPTLKGVRNTNTRLIGIGDVPTIKMESKYLRNWGNREKMNLRNATKKDYCVAIVSFTEQHRRMQETGRSLAVPETVFARGRINYTRAVNKLSYEPFKAMLVHRGSQITRADLDNGVRAGEELWKSFAGFYNQKDTAVAVLELDDLKYTDIDWNGVEPDPSQFTPITWQKAQSSFKEMSKKYDMAHKKWKASGFHDGFETVPFTEFAGQKWLCYMHAFIQESPGILDAITSDLAEGTFFESTTGHADEEDDRQGRNSNASSAAASKKRKATMSANAARDDLLRKIAESSVTSAAANEEKSKAIKLAAVAQTRSTTQAMLESAKAQKKEALKSLKQHTFSKKDNSTDNNRVRVIVNHVGKRLYDANNDEDEERVFALSQETTESIRRLDSFDSVFGHARDYNEAAEQIKQCEKALKALESA